MPCFKSQHAGLTPHQRDMLAGKHLLPLYSDWHDWTAERLPPGSADDVGRHCPALVDSDIAGYMSSFFHNGGELASQTGIGLGSRVADLRDMVPLLEGPSRVYFTRLLGLAEAVVRSLGASPEAS